jgi:hypothetical protein
MLYQAGAKREWITELIGRERYFSDAAEFHRKLDVGKVAHIVFGFFFVSKLWGGLFRPTLFQTLGIPEPSSFLVSRLWGGRGRWAGDF